ncbi:hypothetical protein TSUD_127780 [Trifolium subterraneum]|nr:hypothetical protein TSUD_127780 [Trifolium subterraneum]
MGNGEVTHLNLKQCLNVFHLKGFMRIDIQGENLFIRSHDSDLHAEFVVEGLKNNNERDKIRGLVKRDTL